MKPFKLGSRIKKNMKEGANKLPKYILEFLTSITKNKAKFMKEIRPVPVKLMIKNIETWMSDKIILQTDSRTVSLIIKFRTNSWQNTSTK